MQERNAKFVAPLAVVGAALLAVCTGFASASGTPTGGEIHVYEAAHYAGNIGEVIITGAITDHGTDYQGAGPGGSNLLKLSKGSFAVDVSQIGNKLAGLPIDQTTCSSHGTVRGSLTIIPNSVADTGAYSNIQPGKTPLAATASAAYILPRKNGACDTRQEDYPGVLIVNGSGTVSYAPTNN